MQNYEDGVTFNLVQPNENVKNAIDLNDNHATVKYDVRLSSHQEENLFLLGTSRKLKVKKNQSHRYHE